MRRRRYVDPNTRRLEKKIKDQQIEQRIEQWKKEKAEKDAQIQESSEK
jgi:hypothetical protein